MASMTSRKMSTIVAVMLTKVKKIMKKTPMACKGRNQIILGFGQVRLNDVLLRNLVYQWIDTV